MKTNPFFKPFKKLLKMENRCFSTTVSGNFSISLPGTECTEYIFRLNIHRHTHYDAYAQVYRLTISNVVLNLELLSLFNNKHI